METNLDSLTTLLRPSELATRRTIYGPAMCGKLNDLLEAALKEGNLPQTIRLRDVLRSKGEPKKGLYEGLVDIAGKSYNLVYEAGDSLPQEEASLGWQWEEIKPDGTVYATVSFPGLLDRNDMPMCEFYPKVLILIGKLDVTELTATVDEYVIRIDAQALSAEDLRRMIELLEQMMVETRAALYHEVARTLPEGVLDFTI